jgi:hypothetical protein
MARYSAFLGRRVEVQYRAGDICLPASGTFVADSGRSIFLEQHFEQHGQKRNFRWEIPYQYIIRIEELPVTGASNGSPASPAASPASDAAEPDAAKNSSGGNARAAASVSGGAPSLLPLPHRPKTA